MDMELRPITQRDRIFIAEAWMKTQKQLELKVNHHFSHGIYARELIIPANTILTGEIHKFSNLNILIKGKIKVSIGDEIEIIEAPFIVVSPPGTKRIAHTITDCIWLTIHGTHETNVDKIKEMFIADSEKEWLEFSNDQLELQFNGFHKLIVNKFAGQITITPIINKIGDTVSLTDYDAEALLKYLQKHLGLK